MTSGLACTCGGDTRPAGASHARDCALVVAALGRGQAGAGRPGGGARPGSRHQVAKRTERRGLTFRSRLEAELADQLWARARAEGGLVVRTPRMDLWASWRQGMAKPPTWTPDFLYLRLGHVAEVHEAKTDAGLESQDYAPRLAAFRASYPWVPVWVWRRGGGGRLVSQLLPAAGEEQRRATW